MAGIRDWPADERPREKLLQRGAASLTDAELLAIFLRTGVTGSSAVDLARQLLDRFGSLPALLAADRARFCEAKGLGDAKFTQLQACLEMARRYLEAGLTERDAISQDAYGLLNLNVQLNLENGFGVEAYATNLTGEEYIIDAGNTGDGFGIPTYISGQPTFFGVRLRKSF